MASGPLRAAIAFAACVLAAPAQGAHAYAQFGDIKYPAGFPHFAWVNPNAPKGGDIDLVAPLRITNFDKYNPYTLKGTAPPLLSSLLFEPLLSASMDEPTTAYGLLAEDVDVAADRMSVTFRLNPLARFHDGKPVEAADVKHSFDTLMSKQAAPQYRVVFGDVKDATVVDPRTVRFTFRKGTAELPILVGSALPIFSRAWGGGKPFDQVITDVPISTGPYKMGRMNFGRDITYQRDPNYWAKDLNVRRGMYNFDRITVKIYKDNTAQSEAFKAGEFDYIQVFSARDWARTYTGRKFETKELIREELEPKNAGDFQGFLINTRREKFKDPRVREAIGLAFDFEWMYRQLFYKSYTRVRGFFNNSDFEAKGLPDGDELAVLQALGTKLPEKVLKEPVPMPPTTDPPGSLRANLRKARALLEAAGWKYRDGALRNEKGEPFVMEYLDSGGGERMFVPYTQALAKLGIEARYRRLIRRARAT
jgi:microcin C transport system substrate-binding protein